MATITTETRAAALPRAYPDLHDHIEALRKAGLREYMEGARKIWEELGLPALRPEMPWYGYDLGEWNDHLESQAQRAVRGEYWETGRWCAEQRRGDVPMNTEIRTLDKA